MKQLLKKIFPIKVLKKYYHYKKDKSNTAHKGSKVECPICNSKFKYFEPYGVVKRENARCYNCGSLERDRLLWKYFNEKLDFFKENNKGRVLHLAPEKVFYNFLDPMDHIEYVPCDLSPDRYDYNGKRKVKRADILNIPFKDNYFDFVICNHVLEHIPDDELAMSELYRVMKKGGQGVFQVPIDYNRKVTFEDFSMNTPEEREKAFGQSDHVRWYGLDYKDRLEKAGFKVNVDDFVKSFSQKELKKFGLISTELIYNCSK